MGKIKTLSESRRRNPTQVYTHIQPNNRSLMRGLQRDTTENFIFKVYKQFNLFSDVSILRGISDGNGICRSQGND